MHNRLVPRSEWFHFFEGFSRRHDGWLVTVRVLDPKMGSQVEVADVPLEGIVSQSDAKGPISLHLGATASRNIEHAIRSPRQVWVEVSERETERALEVLSEDGSRTIVEFRVPALPDEVDGILHP